MITRITLFFSILFTSLFWTGSLCAEDLFHDANSAYASGNYEKALKLYQQVLQNEGWSSALLFNLGNTYSRLNRPGDAVLNFKRALYLSPSDPDARAGLSLTLRNAGIYSDDPGWFRHYLSILSLNRWAYIVFYAFAVLSLYIFLAGIFPLLRLRTTRVVRNDGRLNSGFITVCVTIICVALLGISFQISTLSEAVVLSEDTSLLVSPFDGAAHRMTLKPGSIVHIAKDFERYRQIEVSSGQTGWITKDSVEKVVPDI